ncbi:MAG: Nif3-like dinuclear metal center hexameric protein [Anaerolineae bacterium]|nr:Nif3-like dinuclear metal center hexameric protein [Anaerolineae bacterium]
MQRDEVVAYLDEYLRVAEIADYGPQGLQVESGNTTINRVAFAVDVAPPIIAASAEWGADMLLVHHGVLWRSVERIAGPLGARVRALINHGINLYAAHLPLDAHPEVGNNAELARLLGLTVETWWCEAQGTKIGVLGDLAAATPLAQLIDRVNVELNTDARVLAHGSADVQTVAIVSGFGIEHIAEASALGADTFITGETSHASYWAAADFGMNVIFAGHYATETVGVKALGRHLSEQFGLEARFFDFPTAM